MYEVVLLNENGIKFTKKIENEFLYKKFMNKVKYSKTLKVLSYWKEF